MPRLGGSDLPESQPPRSRRGAFPDCSIHIRPRASANRYTESLPSNKFVARYRARRFQPARAPPRDGKSVSTHAARERKLHRLCPACMPEIGPAVSNGRSEERRVGKECRTSMEADDRKKKSRKTSWSGRQDN